VTRPARVQSILSALGTALACEVEPGDRFLRHDLSQPIFDEANRVLNRDGRGLRITNRGEAGWLVERETPSPTACFRCGEDTAGIKPLARSCGATQQNYERLCTNPRHRGADPYCYTIIPGAPPDLVYAPFRAGEHARRRPAPRRE
jgi:hypothetical protein